MNTDIVPFDWHRLWLGDAPPLFLLEVVFRTVVMYLWLLLLLRVVGRRGLSQLSVVEFGIVIALGSAAGDPLFYPEVPLLYGMLVIALIVGMQWGLAQLISRNERAETFMEGHPVCLARGGRLELDGLKQINLSAEELFERLRVAGVSQLGEVQYAFVEQGGQLSVFQYERGKVRPGLSIVPPWDLRAPDEVPESARDDDPIACTNCGQVRAAQLSGQACPRCGDRHATPAVKDPLQDEK